MNKTYENNNFKVVFTSENTFKVTNKFGDTYRCRLENNKIVAPSAIALGYARTARKELNF